jgi:sugar/nucleoside kinase (ribokinase family)
MEFGSATVAVALGRTVAVIAGAERVSEPPQPPPATTASRHIASILWSIALRLPDAATCPVAGEGETVTSVRQESIDVVAIGDAMVDVIAHVDDGFLARHELVKGAMTLIDERAALALYERMPPAIEVSGGSAANTAAGVASLGGRAAYIGKVADDELGAVFRHDLRAIGVAYDVLPAAGGAPTGRCLILVTPDAERTMQTYLGAGVDLAAEDVRDDIVAAARVTYLEGYLWDPPKAKQAFVRAAQVAHAAGRKVSLTLSDAFCVERHRAGFLDLVEHHVDILFANEAEITALYQVRAFDDALQHVRRHCEVAALTRGARGSIILRGDEVHVIDAARVGPVVDVTGAGDLYAAGFLYGYTQGLDLATCGRIGSLAAAEVISHAGARPERPLVELVRARLG